MISRLTLLVVSLLFHSVVLADSLPNPLIYQRADPWVLQHQGRYYLTATVPTYDRIELRAADSLAGLACAEPRTIWERHKSGPMSWHIWAPEIHRIEGKWYIYFAAGRAEDIWAIRMYVLENEADDPFEGHWVEKGEIKSRWDTFSLDATTFQHRDRRYLVWAQHEPGFKGNTSLWIAEMASPWEIRQPQIKISEPQYDWEKQLFSVNEGPSVITRNGRVLISFSASGTDSNYCTGLLYADENADLLAASSWTKISEPIFRSSNDNRIYGPGHGCFTAGPDGKDYFVYHARNYREINGDPLDDPNRHTRVQPVGWDDDGLPILGTPTVETAGEIASKPLYRDPGEDGAADPVVIWNQHRSSWWMFYTNRRARSTDGEGVEWVHGTRIGIAESCDGGATWGHVGYCNIELPDSLGGSNATHWAPDILIVDGMAHMFLTVVPGVFPDWNHPRSIVHLTSIDLRNWTYQSTLSLAGDRVIDAAVLQLPNGKWRMWYNDERTGKSIHAAESIDLYNWTDLGQVVSDQPGEGPKVFFWKDRYWMITDVWDGLGVYSSTDAEIWKRQEGPNLLSSPGSGPDDGVKGGHADVVVQGDRAWLFYFTHPGRLEAGLPDAYETRRSSIQVTELLLEEDRLGAHRDQPVRIKLDPGLFRTYDGMQVVEHEERSSP